MKQKENTIKLHYMRTARTLYGEEGLCYATSGSAGADLRAIIDAPFTLGRGKRAYIPTGIAIEMPSYVMGGIYSRSGLGSKHGIIVTQGVGVIDSDYRGEILVALSNRGTAPYTIAVGERIAQIVFHYIMIPHVQVVEELEETSRGTGAFGSTGKE